MNITDAILQISRLPLAKNNDDRQLRALLVATANQFLFGSKDAAAEISPQAQKSLKKLKLTGDNFELLGSGNNTLVVANDNIVFKLETGEYNFEKGNKEFVKAEDIPQGLSAKILAKGECNGIKFAVCERLNTNYRSILQEVIPFLFKARAAGVVYWDPKPDNFGYDNERNLKVLDHEHFVTLAGKPGKFENSLDTAISDSRAKQFPVIAFDEANTYVVFGNSQSIIEANEKLLKRLIGSLKAVGIHDDDIEVINKPLVVRVAKTEVTYGTPPQTQELADYIDKSLKSAIPQGKKPISPQRDRFS